MRDIILLTVFLLVFGNLFGQSDTLYVNGLKGEFTAKKGMIIAYTGEIHASVGTTFTTYEDGEFLEFLETETVYEQDQKTAGNGGDAARKTYYYKSIKIGDAKLQVIKGFRGKTIAKIDIKIKITE